MKKRLIALLVITPLLLSSELSISHAAAKAGAKCSKVGSKSVVGTKTFTCIKSGKKLVWSEGVVSETKGAVQKNIVFENLSIDLESNPWKWPSDTNSWPARDYPPIKIFGETYQGKVEPALTFDMLKIGQPVISPVDGVVIDNRPQPESCDTELYIMDSKSQQVFSLDHVTSTLKKNDRVKVGQIVATVPARECKEDFGFYELMLVKEVNGIVEAYCPLDFINPTSKPSIFLSISKVTMEWNKVATTERSKYTSKQMSGNLCLTPTAPA